MAMSQLIHLLEAHLVAMLPRVGSHQVDQALHPPFLALAILVVFTVHSLHLQVRLPQENMETNIQSYHYHLQSHLE